VEKKNNSSKFINLSTRNRLHKVSLIRLNFVYLNQKYIGLCRFNFLAHCVCNRCVAKTWPPPGPSTAPMDAPMHSVILLLICPSWQLICHACSYKHNSSRRHRVARIPHYRWISCHRYYDLIASSPSPTVRAGLSQSAALFELSPLPLSSFLPLFSLSVPLPSFPLPSLSLPSTPRSGPLKPTRGLAWGRHANIFGKATVPNLSVLVQGTDCMKLVWYG